MDAESASAEPVDLAVRKISSLSLSNFATADKRDVVLPSYDEEAEPLVQAKDREGQTRLGNVAATESVLESEQQFGQNTTPRTSDFGTMMHLLKGNIGTGILAMPNAVSNAGLLVGSLGIPILGVICIHCMHLLVTSSKTLARKVGCTSLDYPSTAEQAFRMGPSKLQSLSSVARHAVNMMLMLTQFGFCCVYFLFVSKSIYAVVESMHGSSPFSTKVYMAMLLPVMILFNFIRNLKKLSPASFVANIMQCVGLVLVFYYLLAGPHSPSLQPYTAPIWKLPLYFGTAMYAFEGIGVVLPLENSMATPENFGGLTGVLNTGMVIVACLYTAVGFYGYLRYGSAVKSSITFNLPKEFMSEMIRLMFAAAIFLSYALQLYVPLQIIWPFLKRKWRLERFSSREQLILELFFRAILVIFTFMMAVAIPMLDLFIALVGALASSSLALIFPPIIEMCTIWNSKISRKKFYVIATKDILIITLGLIGSIIGTFTAVMEIKYCFEHPTEVKCQS